MQVNLVPVNIVQELPYQGGTAHLKSVGLGDDGHTYALKKTSDHPLLPITEWVSYSLCRATQIPTPDYDVVNIHGSDPAFGSRFETADEYDPNMHSDPLSLNSFFGPKNKKFIEEIFSMDGFLPNQDRHAKNFLFRATPNGLRPIALDFSQAWILLGAPFGIESLDSGSNTMLMWNYLKSTFQYSLNGAILNKIENLPNDWMEKIIAAAPPEWIVGFDKSATINYWINNRKVRCQTVRGLL